MGGLRDQGVKTGRFSYTVCKMGGVGSGSNIAPWILCSAVRTISSSEYLRPALLSHLSYRTDTSVHYYLNVCLVRTSTRFKGTVFLCTSFAFKKSQIFKLVLGS